MKQKKILILFLKKEKILPELQKKHIKKKTQGVPSSSHAR